MFKWRHVWNCLRYGSTQLVIIQTQKFHPTKVTDRSRDKSYIEILISQSLGNNEISQIWHIISKLEVLINSFYFNRFLQVKKLLKLLEIWIQIACWRYGSRYGIFFFLIKFINSTFILILMRYVKGAMMWLE
jgi:hypothetical protein